MNFGLFVVEIVISHICHSLLLNADALYRLSQAMILLIQLLSAKFFHLFPEQNTFGLARIGLVAELINLIFLVAMMLSISLEAIKHIADNITYKRLMLSGQLLNSTRQSLKGHQHFLLHQPQILVWTGLCVLIVNGFQASFYIWTKTLGKFNSRRILSGNEQWSAFKFAGTASDILSRRDVLIQVACQTFGSSLVLTCGLIATRDQVWLSRYIDTLLTFVFIGVGLVTLVPIVREGMYVLIQNYPDSICLTNIKYDIMREVPDVVNVHDLHIWQHIPFSYICTMHVVFGSFKGFEDKMKAIGQVLIDSDIYHFTIQPEFLDPAIKSFKKCLISCPDECQADRCCSALIENYINLGALELEENGNCETANDDEAAAHVVVPSSKLQLT